MWHIVNASEVDRELRELMKPADEEGKGIYYVWRGHSGGFWVDYEEHRAAACHPHGEYAFWLGDGPPTHWPAGRLIREELHT